MTLLLWLAVGYVIVDAFGSFRGHVRSALARRRSGARATRVVTIEARWLIDDLAFRADLERAIQDACARRAEMSAR